MFLNLVPRQDAATGLTGARGTDATKVARMFSRLRLRLAQRLARKPSACDPHAPGPASTEVERAAILRALAEAHAAGRKVTLRDIHRLAMLSQPVALRGVRHLEQAGAIEVEPVDHDPLSGEIRLI